MNAHQLKQYLRMSILYHRRRQDFYEFWETVTKALALIFSSGAGLALLKDKPEVAAWLAFAVTAATLIALVAGTARKATLHASLARRWLDLEHDLIHCGDDVAQQRELEGRISLLEQDEPPTMGVLVRLCQREVMRAEGYDEDRLPQVPWHHRWFAHWIDFQTPPAKTNS